LKKKLTILFFQQLCQIVLYCNNYWHTYFNKFCHKMTSKYLLDGVFILACETQHTYTCHKQRQLRHIRLNVIIIVSNILMKHHIKCVNGKRQCRAIVTHYIRRSNCLLLVLTFLPQRKSSPISRLINGYHARCLTNRPTVTVNRTSPQLARKGF